MGDVLWFGGMELEVVFNWNYNFIFLMYRKCISYNLCYFELGLFIFLVFVGFYWFLEEEI